MGRGAERGAARADFWLDLPFGPFPDAAALAVAIVGPKVLGYGGL